MEKKLIQWFENITKNINQFDTTLNLNDLKGTSIIFIIDMVNGFCKKGILVSSEMKKIIPNIKNLVEKAIKNKIEIIALNDAHNKNSPEFNSYPSHCLENSAESQLVEELQFPEIKIINKNCTNGFFVIDEIKNLDWNNIIVVGGYSDVCLYQFALSCKTWFNQHNKNINVIVPKSMSTTYDSIDHPNDIVNYLSWDSMAKNGIIIVKDIN